jgi:predicted nuclease of predicted toxin-antitoxin system
VLGDSPTDTQLWNYAKEHELIILSKDADFFNRMIISEPPPKIVQLKIGNMRKNDFHNFLSSIWPEVESALQKHKLVRVYRNHLECI